MLQQFLQQLDIDELVRKERPVGVVEQRAQLDRAGRRIDRVVEREQLAVGEFGAVGAVVGFDRHGVPVAQPFGDRRNVVLGDREDHRDRLQLVDDDDAVRVAGRHVVALIDLAQPHPPGDRRDDVRVDQIHLRGLELAFIGFDGADVLVDQRALRIELLHGDRVLLDQPLVALQIQSGVRQQRLVAAQVALHLLHGRLIGARIDLRDEISLPYELPFGEGDFLQDAADLRPHGHGGQRRDRPERRNAQLNIAVGRRGDRHRDRAVLPAGTASARGGRPGRLVLQVSGNEQSEQQRRCDDDQSDRILSRQSTPLAHRGGRLKTFFVMDHEFTTDEGPRRYSKRVLYGLPGGCTT